MKAQMKDTFVEWLAPPVVITSCSLDFFTNNNNYF
jgi:hypothetical protein